MKKEVLKLVGVHVNDYGYGGLLDATFELYVGETIVLAGLYGSGKKTLIDILRGKIESFEGQIYLSGQQVTSGNIRKVCAGRIVSIGKTPTIFDNLSVFDNTYMSGGRNNLFSKIKYNVSAKQMETLLSVLDLELSGRPAGELTGFEKMKLEILKAFIDGVQVMMFYGTDMRCNEEEAGKLKNILEILNSFDIAIIMEYDSYFHIFEEIAVRCIGVRGGMTTMTLYRNKSGRYEDSVMKHIILGHPYERKESSAILEETRGKSGSFLHIIDKKTKQEEFFARGEIIGILDEKELLPRDMEGFLKAANDRYEIDMEDTHIRVSTLRELVKYKIAVIIKEYRESLVFPNLSPVENVCVLARHLTGNGNFYNERIAKYLFDRITNKYKILQNSAHLKGREDCYGLSYERQYEIMLAKWLLIDPAVVVMFGPLGNYDFKKVEDYADFQRELAGTGKTVIIISSSHEQLSQVCSVIRNVD